MKKLFIMLFILLIPLPFALAQGPALPTDPPVPTVEAEKQVPEVAIMDKNVVVARLQALRAALTQTSEQIDALTDQIQAATNERQRLINQRLMQVGAINTLDDLVK